MPSYLKLLVFKYGGHLATQNQVRISRASDFVPNVPTTFVLVAAGKEIQDSINDAWDATSLQMGVFGYDHRVVHTAFGQFLVHNIMQKILENIQGVWPGVDADLVPNSRRTAYHIVIRPPGMLITVSAVNHPLDNPRPAIFRESYASQQMGFGINSAGAFQVLDPPDFSNFACRYFQVRHGPKVDDRQQLGFVIIVPVNGFGRPLSPPQAMDSFLDDLSKRTNARANGQPAVSAVPVEDIQPDLTIQLHPLHPN